MQKTPTPYLKDRLNEIDSQAAIENKRLLRSVVRIKARLQRQTFQKSSCITPAGQQFDPLA